MIEWILSSSLLILIVMGLRFALKGRISLCLQYALWMLVLLRLVIPVSFGASGLSAMNAFENAAWYSGIGAFLDREELPYGTMKDTTLTAEAAEAEHGVTVYKIHGYSVESGRSELHTFFFKASARTVVGSVLTTVWIAVASASAVWLIAVNAALHRRLRRNRKPLKTELSPLPVYVTDEVETPCLFGCFRPAVYLTPEACADAERMRHVIAHELTHYRHFDHVWSLLRAFCLALHWYNPLVWRAAALSRNDAELACDEATIGMLGENERAEYGRTLIEMTCLKRPELLLTATTMTGCKSSIRERITMLAKRPKTAACALIAFLLVAAAAAGCTFTGAKASREFPMSGRSVSALNTASITGRIAELEGLEDPAALYVNADNFELLLAPDFTWASDGAIRFYYQQGQETCSAQLRIFCEDQEYFITESAEWVPQNRFYMLVHYLDALKYLPQNALRLLSPDADGYILTISEEGAPEDFERTILYGPSGTRALDGWLIHLAVQPMVRTGNAESEAFEAAGNAQIHLFYGEE